MSPGTVQRTCTGQFFVALLKWVPSNNQLCATLGRSSPCSRYQYQSGLFFSLWYTLYVRTLGTSTMVKTLNIRQISIPIRQTLK